MLDSSRDAALAAGWTVAFLEKPNIVVAELMLIDADAQHTCTYLPQAGDDGKRGPTNPRAGKSWHRNWHRTNERRSTRTFGHNRPRETLQTRTSLR